jgi:uncharacterized protein YacL (UPF0231 family)
MKKKISTKGEQALDWLRSEIEKDKVQLEKEKLQLINSIKTLNKEELVKPRKKLTLWEKIKKVLIS